MVPPSFLRRRVALPMLCVCGALIAIMAFVVFGDGGPPSPGAHVQLDQRLHGSRPDVRRALTRAAAQRARHASPAAKSERQRSRTRYRDLDGVQALRVGRSEQRAVLRDRPPRPLAGAYKQGMAVAHYASDYAAVLRPRNATAASKNGVMAMSTLPLRSRDTHGRLRSVNMSLEKTGDQFVSDNAPVKVSIGERVGDGFRVSARQLGIVPLDVAALTPGVISGGAVFFANSEKDADHIVRVTPAGAESLVQLRSIDSPQRFRYRLDLPADGALQLRNDGSISVSRDGHRVGTIATPIAWDADQQPIPVTTTLRGNVLELDVAHRGRDIRYPAIVDPAYTDLLQYRWDANDNVNSKTYQQWAYTTNVGTKLAGSFNSTNVGGAANGLYSISRGAQTLLGGSYGYWRFYAPGTTSVAQVEWTHMSHSAAFAGGPAPCIGYGILLNTMAWLVRQGECANFASAYRRTCWDCNDTDGFSYASTIKAAQFGTEVYTTTAANLSDTLGQVTVYLVDIDDPTVTITSQPSSAWTNNPTGTISADASDPGLGVESIDVTGAGSATNSGCLYAGPCPNSMSRSASVTSLNLPDGNNTVAVTARDASYFSHRDAAGNIVPGKHQSSATATVKIDREKPRITATGDLSDARNGFIGPNQDYTLSVTATDGSLSSPATQRAGVTSLSATFDGEALPNASVTTPCSRPEGSCQLSIDTVISAARIDELDDAVPHIVRIRAVDALGQEEIDSFSVRVDKVAPAIYADGNLVELSGRTLTENSYRLRAETRDNQPFAPEVDDDGTSRPVFNLPGAGLRDLVIRLDGQGVNTTRIACIDDEQCEDSRMWDWEASGTPDGPHTITITATDRVGNESVDSFEVTMKHQADAPPRTNNDLRRTIKGAALGDRAGSSVSAIGDMNGDGHADYLVGAPGAGGTAGAAYIVLGSGTPGSIDLANPGSSVRKLSGPAAGANCGTAVGTAGDVNGDGHTDLLVGCPGVDTRLGSLAPTRGKVYVVFGRADVQDVGLGSLDAASNSGFVINGPSDPGTLSLALTQRPAVFGERLQSVPSDDPLPDVNDDGLADIAIGDSAQARGAENAAGTSYVILGKENGNPVDATALGNAGYVIRGTGTNSLTGYSVAISDDLDGDTLSDVVVGSPAPTTGRAFIVNGNREADVDLAANPSGVIALSSGEQGDRFGVNVAALGDTNLDGTADIGIATRAGAFVVRRVPTTDRQISADDGYRVIGPANDPGLLSARIPETTLAAAGDLDGDERRDIIVGFPDAATSRAHTIRSPEGSRTLNVAALAGQRGATLAEGPQGDRSGASVGANQYQGAPVTENAQAIVGAPEAQPEPLRLAAGQAVVIAEPTPTGPGVEPDVPDSEVGAAAAQARAAATAPLTPARCGSASAPCHPRGWYKIDVSPDGAWVTARSEPQLFVIGNALRGNFMHVETQARDRSGKTLYDHGRLYGGLQRCAWIATAAVAGPVDNPIAPQQARACGKRRILAPKAFARLINCGLCNDGSPVRLRPQNGGNLPAQIPTYRNVRPGTREGAYSFAGNIKTRRGDPEEVTVVNWRYITKSKRFALVRLPFLDQERENAWVFIERKWLPKAGRDGLCDNRNQQAMPPVIDPNDARDFHEQKAVNMGARQGRENWAPVCANNRYDGR